LQYSEEFKAGKYEEALIRSFLGIDNLLRAKYVKKAAGTKPKEMGTTACVALITETEIYVANCGDSRCVISRKGIAKQITTDHKVTEKKEIERIAAAGGKIEEGRVNGIIGLTRSLGDLDYKSNTSLTQEQQILSSKPDVFVEKLTKDIDFMLIACDGIWDCLSSQKAVDFVKSDINKKDVKLEQILAKMMDSILPKKIHESCIFLSKIEKK